MQIGLVLPGGGARGAYEAGALSVLIPALAARGERVEIVCGTSVGAINAAVVAAVAAQPAARQAESFLEHWRSVRKSSVISPVIGVGTGLGLLRLAGEVLELPGLRTASLLDPSPLARSLDGWIDWDALHANVAGGVMHAVCVVATSLERGLPVGFVESAAAPPRSDREIHYVHTRLDGQHVRASAAIPLLFPPVEVSAPLGAAGHYVDGATRLNAPIAPALALGADRVIVVGYEPLSGSEPTPRGGLPRLADVAANALDGLLLDQVAHDVRRMLAINAFFAESPATGTSRAARAYREAHGRPPYRRVSPPPPAPSRRPPRAPRARPAGRRAGRRTGGSPTRSWRRRGEARSARWPSGSSRSAMAACAGCARRTSRCSPACSAAAARPRAASCCRSSSSTRSSSSACCRRAAPTPSAGWTRTPASGLRTRPPPASRPPTSRRRRSRSTSSARSGGTRPAVPRNEHPPGPGRPGRGR